jgi:hypothetical protein
MPNERDRDRDRERVAPRGDFERPPSTDEWALIKSQVEAGTRAREKYIPMIERMDERMDALHSTIHKLNVNVETLVTKITPMVTERQMILKAIGYVGGILSGIGLSAATWALIEWLKGLK